MKRSSQPQSGSKQDTPDRVQLFIKRLHNNKWITPLILGGILILVVGSLTDALDKIENFSSKFYQSQKLPSIPRPTENIIPIDKGKKVWAIESSPSESEGKFITLAQTQLRYDSVGLPVLSFVFKNGSDKAILLKGVHIDVERTYRGGGGPSPIMITRALEPIATWNLSISKVLDTGHREKSWSMDMQIPQPVLIGSADAANLEIRLFNTYEGYLIYPNPGLDLTLTFAFDTDGTPRRVVAPPFNFLDHLDMQAMLSAGGCRPVKLPQSGLFTVTPEPEACQ